VGPNIFRWSLPPASAPWGLDIDAFLGAAHRRQRTDPWAHRPQQRIRSLRPRLRRERDDRPCAAEVMIDVGGARPGKISMSTCGHPGRYTFWIGENEEASP